MDPAARAKPKMRNNSRLGLLAGLAAALGACSLAEASDKPALGLFTSLPIFWSEAGDMSEALDSSADPHWALAVLEDDHRLVPLDTLDDGELARLRDLVMAQPRPLAPAENVALDDWVRGGGRLLLFADPMLTGHSRFAIGDRRRPQDVVLLSPILTRWGLELQFDEDQGENERAARIGQSDVPIQLAGTLVPRAGGVGSRCKVSDAGLSASCTVGKGAVLVIADAAMLDSDRADASAALDALLDRAFAD